MHTGYIYIALATLLFSTMEIALKTIAGVFNPLQMTFSRFFIGALVLLTEWRRIAAPAYKKLLSVLTFPLFMLTFIPAAVCAVFAKRGWEPTRHTVAIGIGSLAAAPRE